MHTAKRNENALHPLLALSDRAVAVKSKKCNFHIQAKCFGQPEYDKSVRVEVVVIYLLKPFTVVCMHV